jgi:hypothetical protein
MGAETMLWASDATWVNNLLGRGIAPWFPLMTEMILRAYFGASDVYVGEYVSDATRVKDLHCSSIRVMMTEVTMTE